MMLICVKQLALVYVLAVGLANANEQEYQYQPQPQQQQQYQSPKSNNKNVKNPKSYPNMSVTYGNVNTFGQNMPLRTEPVQPLNYCSFFNNRAPSPQINLKNCTWYRENSCCLQAEIESTFSKVKPLIGSSKICQRYLNSLMCYICAPNQYKFYGKERLTVCKEFCDKMYDACSEAILKGSKISEIYSNGEEFCQGRRYNIGYLKKDNCFYYNIEPLTVSRALFLHQSLLLSMFSFFLSSLFVIQL